MIDDLLNILADGRFHSGRELGEQLGVSRSAIWKQVHHIQESGIEVYSVKGRGYRIPGGLDLLSLENIEAQLSHAVKAQLQRITLEQSIPSTNAAAMQSIYEHGHGSLYLAEQQTAGRGRRGRSWISPFASNLYFSMTWQFSRGAAALEGLSLAVGVALLRGLKELGLNEIEVKWPNDLLWRGRKLAGVLLEMSGDASGDCYVVIGIGVNVNMPRDQAASIDQPWVDLKQIVGQAPSRNTLLAAMLNALMPVLEEFSEHGFEPFLDEWQQANAHADQQVSLHIGQRQVQGICRGVTEAGALLLEGAEGVDEYHGGEVSVRRP
ncbi:MAG: bifunctional biotin--[acetyl-CoA-carboxylase] ligase/biotin operon repressor BirA [Amphritea sp.]